MLIGSKPNSIIKSASFDEYITSDLFTESELYIIPKSEITIKNIIINVEFICSIEIIRRT